MLEIGQNDLEKKHERFTDNRQQDKRRRDGQEEIKKLTRAFSSDKLKWHARNKLQALKTQNN